MQPGNIENIDLDNPEFRQIWNLVNLTNRSVFMTGKAGTGKSTFLRYITANTKKKFVVLAPTGIAAVNAGGVTLHSFFRIPPKPLLPDDVDFSVRRIRERLKYPGWLIKMIRELELIVIDEISMVRADILDFIDKVLRIYSGNRREPFGGKQLLLVGDVFQLEPVAVGEERDLLRRYYPNLYFFSANVFRQTALVPVELSKIYRQKESDFISILDRIRIGNATAMDLNALNSRVLPLGYDMEEAGNGFVMTLATQRSMVDAINDRHLAKIKMPIITYTGRVTGEFPESSMPAPRELHLKNGAQIVFIRNDMNHRWVNGTVARVLAATDETLEVELEDGTRVVVEPERWSNIRYEYDEANKRINEIELGTYTQLPVRLAWALTIHKSQGLTFNKVIIDLGRGAFSSGQTYVALSRCSSLEGLSLRQPVQERDIFVNPAIRDFSLAFNDRELLKSVMDESEAMRLFKESSDLWNNGERVQAAKLFMEALDKKYVISKPEVKRLIATKIAVIQPDEERIRALEGEVIQLTDKLKSVAMRFVTLAQDATCPADGVEPDYKSAFEHLATALDIFPDLPEALRLRGNLYLQTGEFELALENILQVAESPYATVADVLTSADLLDSLGSPHDSLNLLLKAEDRFPDSKEIVKRLLKINEQLELAGEIKRLKDKLARLRRRRK